MIFPIFVRKINSLECQAGQTEPVIKHGRRTRCEGFQEASGYKELSTFECDTGYEFSSGATTEILETTNKLKEVAQNLRCEKGSKKVAIEDHPLYSLFKHEGEACLNKFPVPKDHDTSTLELYMKKVQKSDSKHYETGSFIIFHCPSNLFQTVTGQLSLVTYCQPDGSWSSISIF